MSLKTREASGVMRSITINATPHVQRDLLRRDNSANRMSPRQHDTAMIHLSRRGLCRRRRQLGTLHQRASACWTPVRLRVRSQRSVAMCAHPFHTPSLPNLVNPRFVLGMNWSPAIANRSFGSRKMLHVKSSLAPEVDHLLAGQKRPICNHTCCTSLAHELGIANFIALRGADRRDNSAF